MMSDKLSGLNKSFKLFPIPVPDPWKWSVLGADDGDVGGVFHGGSGTG